MNNEFIDIPSNSNKDIDNQKLMDYISNKLSAEEKAKMEKLIAEPGLLQDALQGLQEFKSKNNLPAFVDQLNAELHKQLQKKIQRRQKRSFKTDQWTYIVIIIILLLIVIAFIVKEKILPGN